MKSFNFFELAIIIIIIIIIIINEHQYSTYSSDKFQGHVIKEQRWRQFYATKLKMFFSVQGQGMVI